jgi:16S rRNA (guanine(966)-N(2))-methyltransferase RsmD
MRIITGKLKGRLVPAPEGSPTRPTTDRVKESIFSMLEARKGLRDAKVLDVFAGSGNLGFEAISRGVASVTFIEQHKAACELIRETASRFGVDKQVQVVQAAAERYLKGPSKPYDIILADPPYEFPFMQAMVNHILEAGWLKPDGWLVLEHDTRNAFLEDARCFSSRPYGRTIVSVFSAAAVEPDEDFDEDDSDDA